MTLRFREDAALARRLSFTLLLDDAR